MYTIINIVIVVAALLLIGIVLIQKSRGGGVSAQFNGFEKQLGVKTSIKFVERATFILGGIILVASIISTFVAP